MNATPASVRASLPSSATSLLWKKLLVLTMTSTVSAMADEPNTSLIGECVAAATPLKLEISELLISGNDSGLSGLAGEVDHAFSDSCALDVRGQDIVIRPKREPFIGTEIRIEGHHDAEMNLVEWRCVGRGIPVVLLPPRCESVGDVSDQIQALAESKQQTDHKDQQFQALLEAFVADARAEVASFDQAVAAAQQEWVLDPTLLTSEEEYLRQREVLVSYRDATHRYASYYTGMVDALREKLSAVGADYPKTEDTVKGMIDWRESQNHIVEPYIEAHVTYSEQLLNLLDMLWPRNGIWSYESRSLVFEDESRNASFKALKNETEKTESQINELAGPYRQLVE